MELTNDIPQLLNWISSRTDEFFEEAPCGFLFTLPDGRILKANRTFMKWLGADDTGFPIQKRFQEILTMGCRIYYETHYAPLLKIQGFLNEVTLDLIAMNSRTIPVLINSQEVKDEMGKVILIRSTVFDISDRRKYEKELLASRLRSEEAERRFGFLATAGDILRQSYDYLENFAALANLSTAKFCDACSIELVDDAKMERIAEASHFTNKVIPPTSEAPQAFIKPIFIEDFYKHSGNIYGPDFEVQSLLSVPIFQRQKFIGRICFYMIEFGRRFSEEDLKLALEISKRASEAIENSKLNFENIKTSEALRESHEWFSTTLKSIGDAVITIGTDKTVTFLNDIAGELTGWSLEEARGKRMDEVFNIVHSRTDEPAFNPVDRVLKEGIIVSLEHNTSLIKKDGTRIIIEDCAAPIKTSTGKIHGVILIFRDVTNKHQEALILQNTLESLQEEREIREKFVATLSHDLRSPITAVKMSAQIILRKTDQPSIVQAQAIRAINSVNRADQMIQDLLDANRIHAGEKIPLEMERCEMVAEIEEAIVDLTTIHGERFLYQGEHEIYGVCSNTALRRVMENLCNNAVKYGSPHTPIIIKLVKKNNDVILSVHNEGYPINPIDQATLFDPYRRTFSAQTGGQKGWGLGLTLVRGVAEAHNGKVYVESSEELGTTFFVQFPQLT